MFEVKDNIITLTRGDSCSLSIDIADSDGTPYTLNEGDTLTFTLKKKIESKEVLLSKELNGTVLNLSPSDTLSLDFGEYVFDIVLKTYDGNVFTIVSVKPFTIAAEVHNNE